MYKTILVPVENRATDETILRHVRPLARLMSAKLILMHVADGWAARNYNHLKLQESDEIRQDREYLAKLEGELQAEGFEATSVLEMGDPATKIIEVAFSAGVDLIAMTTHGHRFLKDLLYGSTITQVRHRAVVPVLLVSVAK